MRRKRKRRPLSVPTASMGDIAFLLIIFFMVCSNFAKEAGKQIKPPVSPDIAKMKESRVSVMVDKNGKMFLQGQPVGSAQEIEAGVAALLHNKKTEDDKVVMFRCDREVDKSVFEPVLDAISKAGGVIGAIGDLGEDKPPRTGPDGRQP